MRFACDMSTAVNHMVVTCMGAAHWDLVARASVVMGRSDDVPGQFIRRPGGVALNIALALAQAAPRPEAVALLSVVGADADGELLLARARAAAVQTGQVLVVAGQSTGNYVAIEDELGLVAAVADTALLERMSPALLSALKACPRAGVLVIDGNLPEPVLDALPRHPAIAGQQELRVVAVSATKAVWLRGLLSAGGATFHVSGEEAEALLGRPLRDAATAARALVDAGARRAIVTAGAAAAADASADDAEPIRAMPPVVSVAQVTGAGDCFVAAHIAAEIWLGMDRAAALQHAVRCAARHVAGDPDVFR